MTRSLITLAVATMAAAPGTVSHAQGDMQVPWDVGERTTYDVKFGPLKVGSGSMEVAGREELRGEPVWHTVFRIKGGTFFYKVDDRMESWFTRDDLSSLRYIQDINEGSRDRTRTFDIFPDRQVFREDEKPEAPSVANPLDDGSFIYFIRTTPMEVGQTYEYQRYFRPDRNPVRIQVLRKERVSVPAGTFDAIVVRPIIKAKGVFSENGQAELWFSDDERRIMLQMKTKLSFGSLNLYLKSYRPPTTATSGR
jgi:hypothetical protein